MKRKILCVLLAAVLVGSLLSSGAVADAYAEDDTEAADISDLTGENKDSENEDTNAADADAAAQESEDGGETVENAENTEAADDAADTDESDDAADTDNSNDVTNTDDSDDVTVDSDTSGDASGETAYGDDANEDTATAEFEESDTETGAGTDDGIASASEGTDDGAAAAADDSDGDDDSGDTADWDTYFSYTSKYSGSLYHIDIVAEGEFTYIYDPYSEDVPPIITITKTWTDSDTVDHSEDSVTVYLLDEDREAITDSDGNKACVTLDESNNWTYSLSGSEYAGEVYYVEEVNVDGYTTTIAYANEENSSSTECYTTTGTLKVTNINWVEYASTNGKKYTIDGSYYVEADDEGRSGSWSQEFFCGEDLEEGQTGTKDSYGYQKNEILRRLGYYESNSSYTTNGWGGYYGPLTTDSTIYINLTYTYEYVDEDGVTQSGSNTTTLTFNANKNNACSYVYSYITTGSYKTGGYTMLGYDAVITSNMWTKAVYENLSTRTVTITNTPETIDIPVEKVWEDDDDAAGLRPKSITVTLCADDVSTGKTLTLSADSGWEGTFEGLTKYNSDGTEIVYTVMETAVNGYESVVTGSADDGYIVTNTISDTEDESKDESEDEEDNSGDDSESSSDSGSDSTSGSSSSTSSVSTPQTGDSSNAVLWVVVAIIALAGVAAVIIYRKKRG